MATANGIDELTEAPAPAKRPRRLPPIPGLEPCLLRRDEAAYFLNIGVTKFDQLVRENPVLKPVRIGALVRWPRENLLAFVRQLSDAVENDDVWSNVSV